MFSGYFKMKTKIVVVGGGTAGWITLAYLAATTDAELVIVHSNEIDIIGVGESTTPTIKNIADAIGLDEHTWMRDSHATYKYGIEFKNYNKIGSDWRHAYNDLLPGQTYQSPLFDFGKHAFEKQTTSAQYFLTQRKLQGAKYDVMHYDKSHGGCSFLTDNRLSPIGLDGKINFSSYHKYSYHVNAHAFGESMRKHTDSTRFTEIHATITNVQYNNHGVQYLELDNGQTIQGDVYVDCTGFKRLLISKLTEYVPHKKLLNNAAVWGQVKGYNSDRPSTVSTAQDSGWIWEIPTWGQMGSGHVMRCLALANALTEAGHRCHFISRDFSGNLCEFVKQKGFEVHILAYKGDENSNTDVIHANWLGASWEHDATEVSKILQTI